MDASNRVITLACLAGGAASLAGSILFGNGVLAAVSAAMFFATLALWKYGYWLVPFATRGLRIVEAGQGYEIVPSQDAVLRKTANGYLASCFIGISLGSPQSSRASGQSAALAELFERAVSSLRCVTKISLLIDNVDLADYLDQLKERRGIAESRLASLSRSSTQSEGARLEREIAYYSRQIEKLGGGQKPMQVLAYAMTTADGSTREEALSRARSQAQQVSAVLSGALGASVWPLQGEDMRRCFEWEFSIPSTSARLADEMF